MPPGELTSTDPCPLCLQAGMRGSYLKNREGHFKSYCANGHEFPDIEQKRALIGLARRAFPEAFAQAPPASPNAPARPPAPAGPIVLDLDNLSVISEVLGTHITSAPQLKGLIFALGTEIRDLKATAAAHGPSPSAQSVGYGRFAIEIPEHYVEACRSEAGNEGKPTEQWLTEQLQYHLEHFFPQTVPTR